MNSRLCFCFFELVSVRGFRYFFEKSAEPTGNQRTHIAEPKPSGTVYISQRAIKESFRPPFSKGGGFSGRRPEAHSAECETLSIVRKTQERVNFFAKQRKRENPRRGFSLICGQFVVKQSGRIISSPTLFLRFVRTSCADCS